MSELEKALAAVGESAPAYRMNDEAFDAVDVLIDDYKALALRLAVRLAEAEKPSEVETVTFTLDKDGTELTFIIGIDGYFTIENLQEIEQEVRDNIADYYDPEFADAGGQAIEKFSVKRVNTHPDEGGGYWELQPFISVGTGKEQPR